MEPEPWEVLDLDLHEDFVLVPSKRKNPLPSLSPPPKTPKTLQPCSLRPQSQSQFHPTRILPGPAGAVQSAMHRKFLMDSDAGEEPIPTQEYIRRAVEDPGHDDQDFSRCPWLFAVDFVRREGLVGSDGMAIGTPLSFIKTGIVTNKVNQIIAIVKSSTPNGLGDMMVTLKDPTGTIDASIHRRVFTEGEFGKDVSVGAVLILQKVAVFSPSRSTHYLNITLGNIVKVISKEYGTPLEQNRPALVVKHAALGVVESSEESPLPSKSISLSQGRTEGILNCLTQNANARSSVPFDKQMEKVNASYRSSSCGSGGSRSQNFGVEKEVLTAREEAAEITEEVALGLQTHVNEQEILLDEQPKSLNQPGSDNLSGDVRCINTSVKFVDISNNEEIGNIDGVKKQSQLLTSKGPLPEWTDEQLEELLAFD
ncbi:hypothetical protein Dsin_008150 [Dipteronia sinensis]|uniref:Homologous recombination OB-fold protein OB-fold domain-containing protein n=1 Tax=Dipteronia sinensis TaxID=43782 RepID=A0AAE0B2D5_9ROSI|nr:hypothetical protein Dsin_008150 [Dipteronia sinensis]